MLRTVFIAVFLSLYIIVVGIPLLLWTVISRNPNALYWGGVKGVMFFVRCVGVKVKASGTERIPAGACLFVANHTSSADAPAVVGAIPRRIAILLKKSLFAYPIVGQAFTLAHFIPVERGNHESAIASLEKATEAIRGGQSFLVYPEGTRSPDGRLQEFKRGAVVMAIKAGVPIVPMVCAGAHKIMEKRSLVIHPGVITVEFLGPIDASAYTFEQRDELNRLVHSAMAEALPEEQKPLA
ncbi:MAG TPA: lysophospholipid acyltransferase family protein [Candidatus Sulfotelmatobacter sp.]|jgi:1-acyl-sn-glycerol-3-phosphate acyltransferase|nr:lysophospholipid acyltransferase family protein [Candidatus Sulfotelmatobacter sp.]